MTNREVAAELYVSVKAVEYHLSSVFAKLGIRSRRELAVSRSGSLPGSVRLLTLARGQEQDRQIKREARVVGIGLELFDNIRRKIEAIGHDANPGHK